MQLGFGSNSIMEFETKTPQTIRLAYFAALGVINDALWLINKLTGSLLQNKPLSKLRLDVL